MNNAAPHTKKFCISASPCSYPVFHQTIGTAVALVCCAKKSSLLEDSTGERWKQSDFTSIIQQRQKQRGEDSQMKNNKGRKGVNMRFGD